ncbi:protein of unknown function [Methylocaldum szegediense]|uniref:Uncharacterized protein n=1 Tax=Methylocaldum szegediense TaxID=73780 RepID=A0ABM9I900_9GAMM|nr:protein of unknown function [Methylocaldum szegediense]
MFERFIERVVAELERYQAPIDNEYEVGQEPEEGITAIGCQHIYRSDINFVAEVEETFWWYFFNGDSQTVRRISD